MVHITETIDNNLVHTLVMRDGEKVYRFTRPTLSVVNGKVTPPVDPDHQRLMDVWRKAEREYLRQGSFALANAVNTYVHGRSVSYYKIAMRTTAIFDGLDKLCAIADPEFTTRKHSLDQLRTYNTFDTEGSLSGRFEL